MLPTVGLEHFTKMALRSLSLLKGSQSSQEMQKSNYVTESAYFLVISSLPDFKINEIGLIVSII